MTLAPGTDARMWDHVGMRNSDFAASVRFYSLLLDTLGVDPPETGDGIVEWDPLAISPVEEGRSVKCGARRARSSAVKDSVTCKGR